MDIARGIDNANLVVGCVGDVNVADSVAPGASGRIDLGRCSCAAIAGRAPSAVAGNEIHQTCRDLDLEYLVACVVGNIDVARGIASNAARLADADLRGLAAGGCAGNAGSAADQSGKVADHAVGRDAANQRGADVGEVDIAKGIGHHGAHIVGGGEADCGGLATVAILIGGSGAGHVTAAGNRETRTAGNGRHGVGQRDGIAGQSNDRRYVDGDGHGRGN